MAQPIQDMMSAGAFGANTAAMGNAGMVSPTPVGAQQISSGGATDKPGLGTVAQLQQLDGFKRQTAEQNMMTAEFGAAAGTNDRMRAQTTAISNAEEQARFLKDNAVATLMEAGGFKTQGTVAMSDAGFANAALQSVATQGNIRRGLGLA